MQAARASQLVARLRELPGVDEVLAQGSQTFVYESDGLTLARGVPAVVALPSTTRGVQGIVRLCNEFEVPFVPRGAGTGLSGGATPVDGCIVVECARMDRVLSIDAVNRTATVQPGLVNAHLTDAVSELGLHYAPDPSSQIACSIGGNIAENSGGVHCLKYGLTTNNVLGIEMVLMSGEVVRFGGKQLDSGGYDLLGVATGSEGLLGVITEVTVRILQKPETARALLLGFPSNKSAGNCVAAIIGAGIIPGGMEMMDELAINFAEDFVNVGYEPNPSAYSALATPGLFAVSYFDTGTGTVNTQIRPGAGCTDLGGTVDVGRCYFTYVPFDNITEDENRYQAFAELTVDLSDTIRFQADALYSRSELTSLNYSPAFPPTQGPRGSGFVSAFTTSPANPGVAAFLDQVGLPQSSPTAPIVAVTNVLYRPFGFLGNPLDPDRGAAGADRQRAGDQQPEIRLCPRHRRDRDRGPGAVERRLGGLTRACVLM